MSEKRGRGQPKFEPTQDQRSQVKLMKAVGIPEDRICQTITNPRTGKPVAPMTLARAFAPELASGVRGDNAVIYGGEGGEAGQADGRGGRGGRSGLPNFRLPDGTSIYDYRRGGDGGNPMGDRQAPSDLPRAQGN